MGEMAQKISNVDKEKLLKTLNIAYAEEWLAYYQYWLGAQLVTGPERKAVAEEFLEHADEEFDHAKKLAKRIIELGGIPILDPSDWQKTAQCKYDSPNKAYVMNLLEQNLIAERCAIVRYQKICEMTHAEDYETYRMAAKILHDEIEHEEEISAFKNDINSMIEYKNSLQS